MQYFSGFVWFYSVICFEFGEFQEKIMFFNFFQIFLLGKMYKEFCMDHKKYYSLFGSVSEARENRGNIIGSVKLWKALWAVFIWGAMLVLPSTEKRQEGLYLFEWNRSFAVKWLIWRVKSWDLCRLYNGEGLFLCILRLWKW